jgi:RNA polymerase sigma-70 factor (ECF subfamily)
MSATPITRAEPTDAACVARSLDDPEAFGALYDRHHLAVFRYVRSRLGPGADDVVGDTFAEAFRSRGKFRDHCDGSALPWLLGIATNRIGRARDAERRWTQACERSANVADPFEDADSRMVAERLAPWLQHALASLRRRDREALLLHVAGDLSVEEVAAALEVPVGTVKSRLHRARRNLSAQLEVHR